MEKKLHIRGQTIKEYIFCIVSTKKKKMCTHCK